MQNPYIIGLISWFLPGSGYFLMGRWKRGLLVGSAIWLMFIIGIFSGGAYYPGYELKDGFLLIMLNIFSKLGNGLGLLISLFIKMNPVQNVAAWATFEYGGRFLEVAGLLNYLATMDTYDIASGRKE